MFKKAKNMNMLCVRAYGRASECMLFGPLIQMPSDAVRSILLLCPMIERFFLQKILPQFFLMNTQNVRHSIIRMAELDILLTTL